MILGPNAASLDAMLGSYHGVSSHTITFVDGITSAVGKAARVEYDMGCDYKDTTRFGGIWAAGNADISIVAIGLTAVYEGEEGDAFLAEGGDRKNLSLPASHIAFLKELRKKTTTPIIAVINAGSAVDIAAIEPYADAILLAWYPGQQGGNALADILFGNISPSGHLPVTFYNSFDDLPSYGNYSMKARTYRYYNGKVQYPFGFGMSYTNFEYVWVNQPTVSKDSISFSARIKNVGKYDGDEVVQVYISYPELPGMPIRELKAFKRLPVKINEEGIAAFTIPVSELQKWDMEKHAWKVYKGNYKITLGSNSSEQHLTAAFKLN
jgi:beta-glucosidase